MAHDIYHCLLNLYKLISLKINDMDINSSYDIESFYYQFDEDLIPDDALFGREESEDEPDEETTLQGAQNAMRFINPVSLK